jgi:hypothetical protein
MCIVMSCGEHAGIFGFQRPDALSAEEQSPLSPPHLLLEVGYPYVPFGQ